MTTTNQFLSFESDAHSTSDIEAETAFQSENEDENASDDEVILRLNVNVHSVHDEVDAADRDLIISVTHCDGGGECLSCCVVFVRFDHHCCFHSDSTSQKSTDAVPVAVDCHCHFDGDLHRDRDYNDYDVAMIHGVGHCHHGTDSLHSNYVCSSPPSFECDAFPIPDSRFDQNHGANQRVVDWHSESHSDDMDHHHFVAHPHSLSLYLSTS